MIDDELIKRYLDIKVKEKGITKIIMGYKRDMEDIEEYKPMEYNKYWFVLFLLFYPFVIFYCFVLNLLN